MRERQGSDIHGVETFVLLAAAMIGLVLLSRRLVQPFPIVLVVGGLLLGFAPNLHVELRSEDVFLLFLPPLLFIAAYTTGWRDFQESLGAILRLAVGLVLATAGAVALVAHARIPELSWPAAFVLGAIVAPTDPVATEAVAERLTLPRRVTVVLSGESLVNDATAIVIFRIALGISLGETFSPLGAAGSLALVSAGGVAVGLAVGWLVARLRRFLPDDAPVENAVSLLTPLLAYLPAERLHVSGVLSVVACGIYLGRLDPRVVSSRTRLQGIVLWRMVTFLLNGFLFLLVGLQLRSLVENLPASTSLRSLAGTALVVSLTVVGVRIAWVAAIDGVAWLQKIARGSSERLPSWRASAIVGWSGMRGGISLAVALTLPASFPNRPALLFVTFAVILVTLVAQGLSLPALIRALGVSSGSEEAEELRRARERAVAAGIERLDFLAADDGIPAEIHEEVRRSYLTRHQRLASQLTDDPTPDIDAEIAAYLHLKKEVLEAERATVVELRDGSEIGDDTLRNIQRDIDLEAARIQALDPDDPET